MSKGHLCSYHSVKVFLLKSSVGAKSRIKVPEHECVKPTTSTGDLLISQNIQPPKVASDAQ